MSIILESQFSQVPSKEAISAIWWEAGDKELHKALLPLMRSIKHEQSQRDRSNHAYLCMFLGIGVAGIEGNRYAIRHQRKGILRANLARAISSAANSKLCKDKVRVLYLTDGGDYWQQTRAKRLTKVINGAFYSTKFYEENTRAQLDSCIFDLGAVYFWREDETIHCERVPGCEIRVDALDARYGKPSQLHREKIVPRNLLLAKYPKKSKIIKEATLSNSIAKSAGQWVDDCVDVFYSWHLPSYPDAGDGKWSVIVDSGVLETGEWKQPFFPFVFHTWESNPFGFYGQSICSEIVGIQHNLDKVIEDIQEHVNLSTGFVALHAGDEFQEQNLTNDVWRILRCTGDPPAYVVPPAFSGEKLQWLDWLVNRAHEDTGLSQLFVTSRKPEGLDSGKALREYNDQNSERFQMVQQRFENTHVQAAEIIRALYEEVYEDKGDFEVKAYGHKTGETIDWEKARMDIDEYVCRPVPTSFLPNTPAAKLQTIQEMLQSGLMSREQAILHLDYPDVERANFLETAPVLNIEWHLEQMLDPDNAALMRPDVKMPLDLAAKMAVATYNDAQSKGAPDNVLEALDQFIAETQRLIEMQQPPPAPMPAPGLGAQPAPEQMAPAPGAPPPPAAPMPQGGLVPMSFMQ